MGSRDFRHHEAKKPKKDIKKPTTASIAPPAPPTEVEVIGKRKKRQEELPEE